ncbi:hypothetical protein MMC20_007158 [Loxospora ochrophaea]|nr:hypothetical protein [Loxospora ochrophaea]
MARTRAQDKADGQPANVIKPPAPKTTQSKPRKEKQPKKEPKSSTSKRARAEETDSKEPQQSEVPPSKPKKSKSSKKAPAKKESAALTEDETTDQPTANPTIQKLLSAHGSFPLQDIGLPEPNSATPETVLAHVFHALLTSARISHQLAYKSVKCLIGAGYHDVNVLKKSSWEERTQVLTEGGYTRYREKTATALGELADLILEKYDGDLNALLTLSSSTPQKTRTLLKEIKGLGDVGVNIFFDTVQAIWPSLAPSLDPRNLQTAEKAGLGGDVEKLWVEVGKSAEQMARLSGALTKVRLEKVEV